MFITGVGKTKFGVSSQNLLQLSSEAINKALEDAGLTFDDINAVYISNFLGGILQNQLHLNSLISSLFLGKYLPIIRVEAACASGGAALHQGLITLDRYETTLVLGVEKMCGYDSALITKAISAAADYYLDQKNGLSFPVSYALIARRYFELYGATSDDLALLSLKAHQNANLNPSAHFYGKEVNLEKIKSSALISSPLRLFDCSAVSDGAAAAIISLKKRTKRDIKIIASSLATDCLSLTQRKEITSFPAAKVAAEKAYKQSGISASDIDFAEVHDCFTIAEAIAMEDLSFCLPGESKELIRMGKTRLEGGLPINSSGGLKATGHPIGATGISQIYEVVTQLRGEAGLRQIKKAAIGLTHNVGGVGGTAVVHILKRD